MKKKKALLKIILIPVLIVILVQGILPFLTLVFSGLKSSLEDNTIQMDAHMVEKSELILENDMIEKWRAIYKESDWLSESLSDVLSGNNGDIQQFLISQDMQQEYLKQVFPELVNTLQYNTTSGVFLILSNGGSVEEAADYNGFFVRDSDPQTKTATNTDLQMERGNKELAHELSISLDTSWTTKFHFEQNGARAADDFFYQPYMAAQEYTNSRMEDLGYWSLPFILEDHTMDNHKMITYSVPLRYDGTIYGVLGVEISLSYLNRYFNVGDLDHNQNAGYALMIDQGDGRYQSILGKGTLYDAVSRSGDFVTLGENVKSELYKVQGASVGKQDIYAIVKTMSLYSNNVPYENTDWVFCGFVTEESVYGLGSSVYMRILITILIGVVLAAVCVFLLVRYVTGPVYRLMDSIRGGVNGIHGFHKSNIREIDELHDVIEKLTDTQTRIEDQLLEEKEHYRIAVESSQDLFFTYRRKEQLLEIVNSNGHDGVWNCDNNPKYMNGSLIHPDDLPRILEVFEKKEKTMNMEVRLCPPELGTYIWVQLSGRFSDDESGEFNRFVGCVHNIQQQKMLEEAQRQQELMDFTTSFYRLKYGIEEIRDRRKTVQDGILAVVDIEKFAYLNEKYGLVFGDLLLEHLAGDIREACEKAGQTDVLGIRAGADQILLWMPQVSVHQAGELMDAVRDVFGDMIGADILTLNFKCGMAKLTGDMTVEEGVKRVKCALNVAKRKKVNTMYYDTLFTEELQMMPEQGFEEIDPFDKLRQMSLSSLTLNLLDRGSELRVSMNMLALKLQEHYEITNLMITKFSAEYLTNTLIYAWKQMGTSRLSEEILHCTGSEYHFFEQYEEMQKLYVISAKDRQDDVFGPFLAGSEGLVFHMMDEGHYSGSIIFLLENRNASILQDEEEQKRLDEVSAIIQNRVNLQQHDRSAQAKSEFLARMSHEIRTPMNGIIGMTEIALKQGQTEERREDCLRKIQGASNYLLSILNDILDMSKIESGKMHLVYEIINMRKSMENLENLLESKIAEKDIQYVCDISMTHNWFSCDILRINQILMNLLSNAVKYSEPGGRVELLVEEKDRSDGYSDVRFAVRDHGIGIEKEKQELIFQSFEQADDSELARRQGTGLGLAISSRLVHMMDSEILLDSTPGYGSTFSFTLHLQQVEKGGKAEQALADPAELRGKRLLVVEDNELNMEIIRTILEGYGILVEEAYDGQQAVSCMKNSEPWAYDLVLMDIMMPVMDGLEAARTIRKLPENWCQKIPIVAMSANAFDEDVRRSLASGMDSHLSKPVNVEKLLETLLKLLKKDTI